MDTRAPTRRLSVSLAARLIDLIRESGLREGDELGTERALLERCGVARGTLREALRQLEWQGVIEIRRGVSGGIRVSTPGRYVPMFMFKVYFELVRMDPLEVRRALRLVQGAIDISSDEKPNPVLEFLRRSADGQFIAALTVSSESGSRPSKLHELVAYRLTLEIEDRALQAGEFLGSEAELMDRLGAGRGVMREALNLMQLNGVVEVRRGPSGGVYVGHPTADFAIYVACVHLAMTNSEEAARMALAALLRASGQPLPWRDAAPGADELADAANLLLAGQTNPVIRLFARLFERFWREFACC